MTASKKAVRTRRGVEPTGRPARREVERGRRARTNSSRTLRYVESDYYENRAGVDRAGRHHDHRPVGQPELFLPARENVSSGRRMQGRRSILHVELGDGENVAHDADGPLACENG